MTSAARHRRSSFILIANVLVQTTLALIAIAVAAVLIVLALVWAFVGLFELIIAIT